jgi:hypothetical protein
MGGINYLEPNPLNRSRLFQAALSILSQKPPVKPKEATVSEHVQGITQADPTHEGTVGQHAQPALGITPNRESTISQHVAGIAQNEPTKEGTISQHAQSFQLSTKQMTQFIKRYSLNAITYERLQSIPLSQLQPEEKNFVLFLTRNPYVFQRISQLDNTPGSLSVQDIRLASQLAGNTMNLSAEDLRYLSQRQGGAATPNRLPDGSATANSVTTSAAETHPPVQELQAFIQKLASLQPNPTPNNGQVGIPYDTLMTFNPRRLGLTAQERRDLEFLRSPGVSQMLSHLADDNNHFVTPDIMRILSSLLWNPLIYGSMPIVFYKSVPRPSDEEVEAIEPAQEIEAIEDEEADIHALKAQMPHFRMTGHDIADICRHISPNGTVTLKQLREYKPRTFSEQKALNLLQQSHIFERLADLDHHPESLSAEDIQLAVSEKALVLSDPSMVLVILP